MVDVGGSGKFFDVEQARWLMFLEFVQQNTSLIGGARQCKQCKQGAVHFRSFLGASTPTRANKQTNCILRWLLSLKYEQ